MAAGRQQTQMVKPTAPECIRSSLDSKDLQYSVKISDQAKTFQISTFPPLKRGTAQPRGLRIGSKRSISRFSRILPYLSTPNKMTSTWIEKSVLWIKSILIINLTKQFSQDFRPLWDNLQWDLPQIQLTPDTRHTCGANDHMQHLIPTLLQ